MKIIERRSALAAVLATGALALGACGESSDGDSADTSGGGSADTSAAAEVVTEATADIAYEGPTSGPKPAASKKIAVITCAAAASGCVRVANGAKEAGEQIGWDVTVLDGQGQPAGQNTAIQQAVSQGVDGIVLVAIDATAVNQGMAAARRAKIPVTSIQADNKVGTGAGEVFAEPVSGSKRAGEALGAYVVDDSGGEAKVALLGTTELAVTRNRLDSFEEQIEACEGCEVVAKEDYLLSSALKDVPLKVSSLLQSNPDIEYLFVDIGQFGALATQSIQSANRDVKVVSVDCNPDDIDNIRKGSPQVACAANALETGGYAALAALNFAFAGEDGADELVVPTKVLVEDNLPETKTWLGDFDPKAEYGKLWGKGS